MEAFEDRKDIKSGVEIRLEPATAQLHKYYGSIGYSDTKSGKEMTKTQQSRKYAFFWSLNLSMGWESIPHQGCLSFN